MNYYSTTIIIKKEKDIKPKELTLKEFSNKEQGIIWVDNKI